VVLLAVVAGRLLIYWLRRRGRNADREARRLRLLQPAAPQIPGNLIDLDIEAMNAALQVDAVAPNLSLMDARGEEGDGEQAEGKEKKRAKKKINFGRRCLTKSEPSVSYNTNDHSVRINIPDEKNSSASEKGKEEAKKKIIIGSGRDDQGELSLMAASGEAKLGAKKKISDGGGHDDQGGFSLMAASGEAKLGAKKKISAGSGHDDQGGFSFVGSGRDDPGELSLMAASGEAKLGAKKKIISGGGHDDQQDLSLMPASGEGKEGAKKKIIVGGGQDDHEEFYDCPLSPEYGIMHESPPALETSDESSPELPSRRKRRPPRRLIEEM